MSKKKGLSLDEKRKRMLDIFYDSKEIFLLKDLEKIAPKQKGIVLQSVKDVVQSLVDDNLVETDKIGTSVYFWAFPSKALTQRRAKLSALTDKLELATEKDNELEEILRSASNGREESDERSKILEELVSFEAEKQVLEAKIKKYEGCDPDFLQKMKKETTQAKESVNRWTDNIFATQSWIQKKFPSININDMNKQFEIPHELDYME